MIKRKERMDHKEASPEWMVFVRLAFFAVQ